LRNGAGNGRFFCLFLVFLLGTFAPGIDRDGNVRINFQTAVRLKKALARRDQYTGRIRNKARIGWTNADYKALWDAENPDDPLEI